MALSPCYRQRLFTDVTSDIERHLTFAPLGVVLKIYEDING